MDSLRAQWTEFKNAPSREMTELRPLILSTCSLLLEEPTAEGAPFLLLQDICAAYAEAPEASASLQEYLVDLIWLFDLDIEANADNDPSCSQTSLSAVSSDSMVASLSFKDDKAKLVSFAQLLLQASLVSTALLFERLELDLLEAIGAVSSAAAVTKKIARVNTALFYKQLKFNLLREESEGFCRLIAYFATCFEHLRPGEYDIEEAVRSLHCQVLEMIGYFDLDPVKILDILLDALTHNLAHSAVFLLLIRKLDYPSTTIASVFGFKLGFVYQERKFDTEYLERLSLALAALLKDRLVALNELYPHLEPSDETVFEEIELNRRAIREATAKIGTVNLSSSAKPEPTSSLAKALEPESLSEHFAQDSLGTNLAKFQADRNQKAHLAAALLALDAFDLADTLLSRLPGLAELLLLVPRHLCRVIDHIFGDAAVNQASASHWLCHMPSGFLDPQTFSRLCAATRAHLTADPDAPFWNAVLTKHLIPTLAFASMSASALGHELWSVLEVLPLKRRYALYGFWAQGLYESSPSLSYCRALAVSEARKVMRRLAKETVRQYGRLVAKVAHSNPVAVLPLVIDQVQAYDNMIQPVVEAFRFLTPLDFDVLIFSILRVLSDESRERLKDDGTNLSDWLQALASFLAALFRRYYQNDTLRLEPVIAYVYGQLVDDNCLDLVILTGLLQKLAGVENPETATELLIEAQSGGKALLSKVIATNQKSLGISKPPKRAILRLFNAIQGQGLVIPLLIALAQAEDAAVYRMDYEHLKLVSLLADTCQSAYQQYIELLSLVYGLDPAFLSDQQLPSLSELVSTYKLDLAIALNLTRIWAQFSSPSGSATPITKAVSAALTEPNPISGLIPASECSQRLIALFWLLELRDIHVPLGRYQAELIRLKTLSETEALDISVLETEMKEQVTHCSRVAAFLKQNHNMLAAADAKTFLNCALLPRALFSPSDAIFAAKFLFMYHCAFSDASMLQPLLELLFSNLGAIVASLTESESQHFGRFLQDILGVLAGWHAQEDRFTREAQSHGFNQFGKDADQNGSAAETVQDAEATETASQTVELSVFEEFKQQLFVWHGTICQAFLDSFASDEYISIRNSIVILTRLNAFPAVDRHARLLGSAVSRIRETDKREDLKVLATRLSAMLTQCQPRMVSPKAFGSTQPDLDLPDEPTEQTESIESTEPASSAAVEEGEITSGTLKRSSSTVQTADETDEAQNRKRSRVNRETRYGRDESRETDRNRGAEWDRNYKHDRERNAQHERGYARDWNRHGEGPKNSHFEPREDSQSFRLESKNRRSGRYEEHESLRVEWDREKDGERGKYKDAGRDKNSDRDKSGDRGRGRDRDSQSHSHGHSHSHSYRDRESEHRSESGASSSRASSSTNPHPESPARRDQETRSSQSNRFPRK